MLIIFESFYLGCCCWNSLEFPLLWVFMLCIWSTSAHLFEFISIALWCIAFMFTFCKVSVLHHFVLLHTIFLSLHVLCAILGVSAFIFQFALVSLLLLYVHNKLNPSLHCLGEKHAPLPPRIFIVFMLIFVECSVLFLDVVMFSSCFHVYLFKRAFI